MDFHKTRYEYKSTGCQPMFALFFFVHPITLASTEQTSNQGNSLTPFRVHLSTVMQLQFQWLQRTTYWPARRLSPSFVEGAPPRGIINGEKWRDMSKCKHTYCRVWNLNIININLVLKNTFLLSMLCSVLIVNFSLIWRWRQTRHSYKVFLLWFWPKLWSFDKL